MERGFEQIDLKYFGETFGPLMPSSSVRLLSVIACELESVCGVLM